MSTPSPEQIARRIADATADPGFHDIAVRQITAAIQAASNEQLERCRAHDRQADVAAFHRKFNVPTPERPGFPSQERMDLRVKLIAEEFCEFLRDAGYNYTVSVSREEDGGMRHYGVFAHAYTEIGTKRVPNLPKAADALIDLEYVILGTHVEFGIDSNPLWAEVQRANMSKQGGGERADGKILKGPDFQPPDIEGELRKQGWSE